MKNRKRLLLVGNYGPDSQPSMYYFGQALLNGIDQTKFEVEMVTVKEYFGPLSKTFPIFSKWFGYIDKMILFPRILREMKGRFDLIHVLDHSYGWLIPVISDRRHLVTCHDLLAIRSAHGEFKPYHRTRWTGKRLQEMIFKGLSQSRCIVAVSESTRENVDRLMSHSCNEVGVIFNGLNRTFQRWDQSVALEFLMSHYPFWGKLKESRYILHVGKNTWYKNRINLLKGFAIASRKCKESLVLAGDFLSEVEEQFCEKEGIRSRIYPIGRVQDDTVQALYSLAHLFVFPSMIEGFGWPVIEAQAMGCPVITSDVEPLCSFGGDAAQWVNPMNPESIARGMLQLLDEDEVQRENRVKRGYQNAALYSQKKMIDQYQDLYLRLLE